MSKWIGNGEGPCERYHYAPVQHALLQQPLLRATVLLSKKPSG
jgi:hypothetical protein